MASRMPMPALQVAVVHDGGAAEGGEGPAVIVDHGRIGDFRQAADGTQDAQRLACMSLGHMVGEGRGEDDIPSLRVPVCAVRSRWSCRHRQDRRHQGDGEQMARPSSMEMRWHDAAASHRQSERVCFKFDWSAWRLLNHEPLRIGCQVRQYHLLRAADLVLPERLNWMNLTAPETLAQDTPAPQGDCGR